MIDVFSSFGFPHLVVVKCSDTSEEHIPSILKATEFFEVGAEVKRRCVIIKGGVKESSQSRLPKTKRRGRIITNNLELIFRSTSLFP